MSTCLLNGSDYVWCGFVEPRSAVLFQVLFQDLRPESAERRLSGTLIPLIRGFADGNRLLV